MAAPRFDNFSKKEIIPGHELLFHDHDFSREWKSAADFISRESCCWLPSYARQNLPPKPKSKPAHSLIPIQGIWTQDHTRVGNKHAWVGWYLKIKCCYRDSNPWQGNENKWISIARHQPVGPHCCCAFCCTCIYNNVNEP